MSYVCSSVAQKYGCSPFSFSLSPNEPRTKVTLRPADLIKTALLGFFVRFDIDCNTAGQKDWHRYEIVLQNFVHEQHNLFWYDLFFLRTSANMSEPKEFQSSPVIPQETNEKNDTSKDVLIETESETEGAKKSTSKLREDFSPLIYPVATTPKNHVDYSDTETLNALKEFKQLQYQRNEFFKLWRM